EVVIPRSLGSAQGALRQLRCKPALFSVVTSDPLGQFSSHAPGIGLLRRGIRAASNHRGTALRVTGYIGINLRHQTRVDPGVFIVPYRPPPPPGVFVPPQKPASDGEGVQFSRSRFTRALRFDAAAA